MSEQYIRPEQVCKMLKVTTRTLYNWDSKGKLKSIRTKGGHRRYLLSDILSKTESLPYSPYSILAPDQYHQTPEIKGRQICYCRVSTRGQGKDLERQIEYFKLQYPNHEIIKDYGSGINFKRKGFNSILDSAIKGDISEVVVTHKDRLCRFGDNNKEIRLLDSVSILRTIGHRVRGGGIRQCVDDHHRCERDRGSAIVV
jgi:putative resolvase